MEKEDEQKEKTDKNNTKVGIGTRIFLWFYVIIICLSLGMCARFCSQLSGSDHDEWDNLQQHIDSDPYYKQWD